MVKVTVAYSLSNVQKHKKHTNAKGSDLSEGIKKHIRGTGGRGGSFLNRTSKTAPANTDAAFIVRTDQLEQLNVLFINQSLVCACRHTIVLNLIIFDNA